MRSLVILIICVVALPCFGAYTTSDINYDNVSNPDTLTTMLRDLFDNYQGTSVLFDPQTSAPSTSEGKLYYNDTANALYLYNGTSWLAVDSAGGNSLGTAYTSGSKIVAITDAVEIEVTDGSNNVALLIDHDEATNDNDAMQITNAADSATAVSLQIDGTAGYDIQGTSDTWNVSIAGKASLVGIDTTDDITLENDEVIKNDNNGEIELGNGTEDTAFAWGTNELQLSSDTGVVTVNWGDLDAFTGVQSITGDAADMTIQMTADAAGEDLLIQQAGSVNGSLDLRSAGTGTDAVKVVASAGGIDVDAANSTLTITNTANGAADDFTIAQAGAADASLHLASAGTGADALTLITTAGGIDITTPATFDIDLTAVGGKVNVTPSEAAADQFKVDATGTVAGDAINLETTDGGVMVNADGASNGDIELNAADDMTLTAAGDLTLAVTGTLKGGGANIDNVQCTTEVVAGTTDVLTAAQSGQTLIYTMTGGACTVTLPEATAATVGVFYRLIDGNATAGNDLTIDPEGDGTINGDTAGNYIKNETDGDGCMCYIVCTAADTWYAVMNIAVWTEE